MFLCQYSKVSKYQLAQTQTLVNLPYCQANNPLLSNEKKHALVIFSNTNSHIMLRLIEGNLVHSKI